MPEVITDDDSPVVAVPEKKLIHDYCPAAGNGKKADVAVSAGNTGALMAGACLLAAACQALNACPDYYCPDFDGAVLFT